MEISVTLIITIITVAVSLWGFSNPKVIDNLIFFGPAISRNRQYYRFLTHGLIHADLMHLAFNMIALYTFGAFLESPALFGNPAVFGADARLYFAGLYIGGLIIASVPDYFKHRDDYAFRSLGASGAISSVIFAGILLYPALPIRFIFLPIDIPGWIFGGLYLLISAYLDRQGGGRINHGAHLWGAVFGIVFIIVFVSLKGEFNVFENFIRHIRG
ncbi:rhomboid family intramembrane serine protease [Niabella drilacis]|uniref:Rhomboid family protein n=1 Tax=Niabella drilacis (strain DSM 25811 / CCM 8410 / CCUG 62505 / LMG 26954 / E90) TaxID=1285928 RepID=A0A1G6J693_NIADE|nr:rhomboid family intramembrane serine protease [Niabella drilacis]SDC13466.1 Rhomboid family protein [Niabella drilacis]